MSLKPCPFCGAHDPDVYLDDDKAWTIECRECNGLFVSGTSRDRASSGWNSRATERELLEVCRQVLAEIQHVELSEIQYVDLAEMQIVDFADLRERLAAIIAKAEGPTA